MKQVTWYGAVRYCDWLSLQQGVPRAYHGGDWACNYGDPYGAEEYRLPTDAEWEYAAQWNDDRIYPWGNEAPDCNRGNCLVAHACVGWSTSVGSYPDAPPALGLSDMAGNTFELVNDWQWCNLGTAPVIDPVGPASGQYGTYKVIRGGSWGLDFCCFYRCADRYIAGVYGATGDVGFRVARTVTP